MRRIIIALLVAVACGMAAGVASADPAISGRWREKWGIFQSRTVRFELACLGSGTWRAEVAAPRDRAPRQLTLYGHEGRWTMRVERRVRSVGLAGALEGAEGEWTWGDAREVALQRQGDDLVGGGFVIHRPLGATAPTSTSTEPPVVRVLITGFDKFPRPVNHPHWVGMSAAPESRVPRTNPSGWAVRNFDLALIDAALRSRVRIELHRLTDVPVLYVEGARVITSKIEEVDADVCISTGVGAGGNADADVETTCSNMMNDGGMSNEGHGPFQLPASWPPAGPQNEWSNADQRWMFRYPDNAGVSYNNMPIDPTKPERLRSSLPVAQIVRRCQQSGLEANDGMGGPGQYICNNVMFKVVDTQAQRGRIGGFIHLAQWEESRRDRHLRVLACAIEESVKAYLERRPAQ
jgi:pyrrolidone-carboxylate peptidase